MSTNMSTDDEQDSWMGHSLGYSLDSRLLLISDAVDTRNVEEVRRLLENGEADINESDANGRTPLMLASRFGYQEIVQMLLEHNALVNAFNEARQTALMLASKDGHADVVRLLLEHNADVNASDDVRQTALMLASMDGHVDVVALLLPNMQAEAVNAVDQNGRTAHAYAVRNGHGNVATLLEQHGATRRDIPIAVDVPDDPGSVSVLDDSTMEKEPNDLPDVFFSQTNTSREVHDSLVVEIEKLQTPEECRKFYNRPIFNNCLQNLGNAQQRYRDSDGGDHDDWAKMWALAKSSSSSRTQEQAECYDRDRKVCLKLLYRVCNLCFRKPPTEDTVPSLKTTDDDGMDGLNGLVKVFEIRRIIDIVVLCLPMDRANALYHMRNRPTQELYRCWLGHRHLEENGPKLQNKRFWWLFGTEELAFGTQERDLMRKWLQRVDPDDSTLA